MLDKIHFCDVIGPSACGLPNLIRVGIETRCNPAYGQRGSTRTIDEPCCIFQYTLSGYGLFEDERGVVKLPPGTGFLCESHDSRIAYRYPAGATEPWQFVYMSFNLEPLAVAVRRIGEEWGRTFFLPSDCGVIHELIRLANGSEPSLHLAPGEGAALIFDILGKIVSSIALPIESNHEEDQLQKITRAIDSELEFGRLDLTNLARSVGMSREHLCRFFRAKTGTTAYQFVLRKQMLLACKWLTEEDLAVKEIADRLGFSTPANFSRAFKHVTGMTTRQFRKSGLHIPNLDSGGHPKGRSM